jgi:hypothetical protein
LNATVPAAILDLVDDDWRSAYAQLEQRLQRMRQLLESAQKETKIRQDTNAAAREQFQNIRVERRKTSRGDEPTDINAYRNRRRKIG